MVVYPLNFSKQFYSTHNMLYMLSAMKNFSVLQECRYYSRPLLARSKHFQLT